MLDIEHLKKEVRSYFADFGPHDINHTERVYKTAVMLARRESADMHIVTVAAYLHDIGRMSEMQDKTLCHAEEGSRIAAAILRGKTEKLEEITYCIKVHRFKKGIIPQTLEAKIIQDADRLDSLGAVVIARTFAQDGISGKPIHDPAIPPSERYTGHSSTGINHLHEKILKIIPDNFHTETAKEIAEGRYRFVKNYVQQFKLEWEGQC